MADNGEEEVPAPAPAEETPAETAETTAGEQVTDENAAANVTEEAGAENTDKPTEEAPPAEESAEGQPPADGEQPPAEGEQPPAEGEQPAAEGEQPPAEGEQPPTEGEQPPVEGEEPPAEAEKTVDGEQQPTDAEQTAAEAEGTQENQQQDTEQVEKEGEPQADAEQPTKEGEQPADAEQPPAEGEQPVDGEQPSAEERPAEAEGEPAQPEQTEQVLPPEDNVPKPSEPTEPSVVSKPRQVTPEPQRETVGTGTDPDAKYPELDPKGESPTPGINLDANVTVKFVLMPSGQVATLACTLGQSLSQLKAHFAGELKIPASVILLMFDGKNMDDTTTLADLGVGPNGTVQLEMQSADPINTPIKAFKPRVEYHMPDVITVRAKTDDGKEEKVFVVEIERATKRKPYMGGYRHKKTGVEFHHASTQTMGKQKPPSNVERFCRDTQTVQQRHRVQQTTQDTSTQMTKIGVFVSNIQDKLVVPGKYTTAETFHANILSKVIIIQKYYRRWLAKRQVHKLRQDKIMRMEWERKEEIKKKKEKEDRIKREFERRMNPKTQEDFDLLYHALEQWRKEELEHINSTLSGAERKAALCQLLEQETQLIASIGQHKSEANSENKEKSIQRFLDKAAAPKRWKGGDGKYTEMDTPYTIRAQELKDIYNSINMKYLTQDERLDVLLTLKHTIKEHDCKLTQEIIELIDREADLLMRGVKENNLDGLRKRISTLFLQYIKTPTFNPEAARLLKVPQDASILRKNIYYCNSCNSYLPSTEFMLSSNTSTVGKCRRCIKLDNDARVRQDLSHYRYMLKSLRRAEEEFGDGAKIAFLLQESDLRYLIENIWNNQSILSAWDDLYDLVLCRWDKTQEWAPWNCVLLTKDEASAHMKLTDLKEGYGHVLMHKVKHKHTLARNYFSRLPGMAEHMHRKSIQSAKSTLSQDSPGLTGQAVPMQPMKA